MQTRIPAAPAITRPFLQSSAVGLLLGLAGCAEMRWEKPGIDAATRDQELERCTQQARLDARREETPGLDSALVYRADPMGRPVVVPNPAREDRYLVEQDYIGVCMRGKGYLLAPAEKKG